MAYINSNGQVRIGVRSLTNSPIVQPAFSASLLQSLYGVWNGDTTNTELSTSIFGAWNAENTTNSLDTNIYSVFTDTTTYTPTGITVSQVGLWDAEGLGLNDKVGTNHLTSYNSATFSTTSLLGTKSFTFNGSNYFGLPNNAWNYTDDFSLSFWLNGTMPGSGGPIVISNNVWVQSSPTIKYSGWDIRFSGPFPAFYGVSGGTTSFYISSNVQCNNSVWNNIIVTKSSGVVSIYVNGLLGGTSSVSGNISYAATSYPTIGAQKYSSGGISDYVSNGWKIDDVATWTRELSHDDVISIYNSGSGQTYPYTSPVSISTDKYQSLRGFVIGTGSSTVSGKTGNAISLTQSTAIVLKDRTSLKFTGDFSVSFWFRTHDVTTQRSLLSTSDGTKGWWIYISAGNILWSSGGSANVAFGFNPTTLVANTWYHVAVSFTNNVDIKCYLNGVLGGQQSMVSKTITYNYWNNFHPAVIGGRANRNVNTSIEIDRRFVGTIDDINSWTRAISLSEVQQLYNGGTGVEYPYSGKSLSSPNDSVSTNHGTLMNGCTFTSGKIGSAFTFDGVNDYVQLPNNIFNFTGDFTASAWVYVQTLPSSASGIVGNFDFGAFGGWGMYISGANLVGVISNSGGRYYLGSTTGVFTAGQWSHVVMVFKKNIGFYIYGNGVSRGQSLASTNPNFGVSPNSAVNSRIGLLNYSGDWWWMPNGSRIDSVNVWNRALSQDEITQLYNSGTGAQYPFTGTFSSAGNQLGMDNGTLMNGCSLTTGKIGQAFTFDEINDYVSLPNNSLNFTGDFSVSFWVYTNISHRVQRFFSSYSTGNTYGYGHYCGMDNGRMELIFVNGGTHESTYTVPYTWTQNWHHVVITRKRSTSTKVYINGNLMSGSFTFGDVTKNPSYQSTQICNLGGINNGTSNLLNGKIDAFTTWQKELTQTEVTELYNSGNGKQITATPIVQTGLVLNLDASRKSSYNTGTTWTDLSGNSLNGTLTNGPIFGTAGDGNITFDGINDFVSLPDSSILQPSNITISTWFKLNQYGTNYVYGNANACVIRKGMYGYEISVRQDGKLSVFAYSDVNTQNQYLIDSISLNTWYNVVLTFGNSQMKVYINNTLVGTYATNTNSLYYAGGGISIGRQAHWDMYYFNGNIASTLIYNRVLSSTEITQNYNATKTKFGY